MTLSRVPVIGAGTLADPFRPSTPALEWWCSEYDLKAGVCLVATDPGSAAGGNAESKGLRAGVTRGTVSPGGTAELVVSEASPREDVEGVIEGSATKLSIPTDARGAGSLSARVPATSPAGFLKIALRGKASDRKADVYVMVG